MAIAECLATALQRPRKVVQSTTIVSHTHTQNYTCLGALVLVLGEAQWLHVHAPLDKSQDTAHIMCD